MVADTKRDPLYHNKGTPRLGTEIQAAIARVNAEAGLLEIPLLVLQGGEDRIVSPAAVRRCFASAGSSDKELKVYDGAYHELDRDLDADLVAGDLIAWVARRCAPAARAPPRPRVTGHPAPSGSTAGFESWTSARARG